MTGHRRASSKDFPVISSLGDAVAVAILRRNEARESCPRSTHRDFVMHATAKDGTSCGRAPSASGHHHGVTRSMTLDLTGYKQTFNDDFNSFSSTPQSDGGWQSTIYGARTLSNNGEQQFYSDSTVGVNPFSAHDGTLTITASPGSNPDGLAYNSGVISTLGDFSQEYGYFEMTAKLPQGAGMWPGFWLLQSDHSWPPELDILEAFGATNSRGEGGADQAHINLISTVPGESQGNWVHVSGDIYNEFHRYGVDWEPDTITYYIDGQEVGKVATPSDMHKPMYMVANLAVGGGWAENPNGETSSMVIDSIRAYSKDPSAVAVAQLSAINDASSATHATDGTSDASIMPPAGSAQTNTNGGASTSSTDATPPGDASTPTDATHALASDTTSGPSTADAGTVGAGTDHAVGSPNVTTAGDSALTDAGVSSPSVDSTATDTHPGTAVVDGSTGGTATDMDHAVGSPNVTTLGSDTPSANVGTPGTGTTTTDPAHPGTAVADGSTGGTPADHAVGAPNVTGDMGAIDAPGVSAPAIAPNAAGAAGPSAAGLTLHVSADSWNGNPQFQVFVDGKQAGDVRTTTADHGAGQWEDIAINGDFGSGAHVVDVKFVNDAWNGTANTDRNLYVQAIAMNGVTLAGNEAANNAHHGASATDPSAAVMQINGDVEFHVPQSTATSDLWAS
jgi:beta-glucanase (GH16 family)